MKTKNEHLAKQRRKEVVDKYGGRNLSRILNISHPAVSKWKVVPPYRALQIEELGDFKAEYIRPDIPVRPCPIRKKSIPKRRSKFLRDQSY